MDATEELPAVTADAGAPAVLGRYRLGARLGSGGFGIVYAAHDERLDRHVAVKVIPAGAPAPERASREALAAARLDHPGIVAVFDAGEDEEARYLVSELVRGRTLDRLAKDGDLSDRDVLRVGLALAEALEHAHERGVIHRDVKPQNVIVPDRPRSARSAAKLTDFGVAHLAGDAPLTKTGDVVGTLAYMAPEQASGRPADERADLYSLALVLYEGLAGVNPVRGGSPAATAKRLGQPIPPLQRKRKDLPHELCAALDRALLPRPEDRGTLEELAAELAEALPAVSDDGGTVLAHPLERAATATLPPAAGRAAAGLAAAGLAAAAATLLAAEPETTAPVVSPLVAAGVALVLVAALPRAGWLACALAATALLVAHDEPGAAAVLAAGAVVPPLIVAAAGTLVPRRGVRSTGRARSLPAVHGTGRAWSLPAMAPLLGFATLATAYPALAGRARTALQRAALGAAGVWWLLLAEPLLGRNLLFGTEPPPTWREDAEVAVTEVLGPPFTTGLVAVAAVWALAALLLPWLVRGRRLGADVVGASAWAAGLGSGTAAVAEWAGAQPPYGLTGGAIAAGVLAFLGPRLLPRDIVDP
jgi:eukaryotic-like serine/threonine-protein kinase